MATHVQRSVCKAHVSFNAEAQMITSVIVSPGHRHDGHHLPSLIESDLAQDLPIGTCTADRAYDDTDNHFFLQTRGIRSAIQVYLTAMALNWLRHVYDLKRLVRLLTGVPSKGKVPVMIYTQGCSAPRGRGSTPGAVPWLERASPATPRCTERSVSEPKDV